MNQHTNPKPLICRPKGLVDFLNYSVFWNLWKPHTVNCICKMLILKCVNVAHNTGARRACSIQMILWENVKVFSHPAWWRRVLSSSCPWVTCGESWNTELSIFTSTLDFGITHKALYRSEAIQNGTIKINFISVVSTWPFLFQCGLLCRKRTRFCSCFLAWCFVSCEVGSMGAIPTLWLHPYTWVWEKRPGFLQLAWGLLLLLFSFF